MGKHRTGSQVENTGDYEVGYKKPPRHSQFKKGQSGNKGGRPKRSVDVKASVTKMLSDPVLVRIDGKAKKMSTLEATLVTLKANMLKGDLKALMAIIKLASLAGIISVPQEEETDHTALSADEEAMIAQAVAEFTKAQPSSGCLH
jgi:hypothetical protein